MPIYVQNKKSSSDPSDLSNIREIYLTNEDGEIKPIYQVYVSLKEYNMTDDEGELLADDDGTVLASNEIYPPYLVWQYDMEPPTVIITEPSSSDESDPTYTTSSSYTIYGTATDSGSGVKAVYVNGNLATLDGDNWSYTITLSNDTTTSISVYAIDDANNTSETITRYVMYDSAVPTLSVTAPTGTSSSSPTYTTSSSYTVSGTASDTGSGIDYITVNGTKASGTTSWSVSLTLTADTATTLTVIAYDKAGRSTTVTRYVMYDSAVPTISVTQPTSTSSSSPTYTTSSSYTVSGTASDTGSGVASVTVNGNTASGTTSWSYSLSLSANSTTTVTIIVTDNAGRTATVTRYVMYDSAAPTVSVTAPTGSSSSSPTYTTSSSYTVSGTASDSGSGIKSVTVNGNTCSGTTSWSYSLSLSANSTTTVTIIATDNAGRTTTVTRYVMYDSAAPTLTITAPTSSDSTSPTTTTSSSYTASCTATDSGSGISGVTIGGSSATASGSTYSRTLSLTANSVTSVAFVATDKAGRSTSATRYVLRTQATAGTVLYHYGTRDVTWTARTSYGSMIYTNSLYWGKGSTRYVYVHVLTKNASTLSLGYTVSVSDGSVHPQLDSSGNFNGTTVSTSLTTGWNRLSVTLSSSASDDYILLALWITGGSSNVSWGSSYVTLGSGDYTTTIDYVSYYTS